MRGLVKPSASNVRGDFLEIPQHCVTRVYVAHAVADTLHFYAGEGGRRVDVERPGDEGAHAAFFYEHACALTEYEAASAYA